MRSSYYKGSYLSKNSKAIVRPEINLLKWPQIFAPHQSKARSRVIQRGDEKVIVGRHIDHRNNETELGLLVVPDMVKLYGLIYMWELLDRPVDKDMPVDVRGFITDVLRQKPGGSTYRELEFSLRRLRHTPVTWINSFYSARTERKETMSETNYFTFLQALKTRKENVIEGGKLQWTKFFFRFSSDFQNNLNERKITSPRLLHEIISLKREMSVLAYTFLDIVMSAGKGRTYWERKVPNFIQDDLQIQAVRYQRPAHCLAETKKIITELNEREISTGTLEFALKEDKNDARNSLLIVRKVPKNNVWKHDNRLAVNSEDEVELLVNRMGQELGAAQKNRGYYYLLARRCSFEMIVNTLDFAERQYRKGEIHTSKRAYFCWHMEQQCKEKGIELRSKPIKLPKSSS